jgi:hypothetical protein
MTNMFSMLYLVIDLREHLILFCTMYWVFCVMLSLRTNALLHKGLTFA